MPGKPYTMKEMKQIVEYLVERKAYSEIRGRKMWVDLAKSRILNRTWQSLKETFLKRILPDIQNPYYKLSIEQISSFRQEYDVEAKYNRNKLEVHTISDSSSTDNQRGKEKAEVKQEVGNAGEVICSKIQDRTRSSTETLVLENCYETAEDVRRDLESPADKSKSPQKSIRDFITYSEPLTPMLQEVLHDFSTDDEEPQMQIVEEPEVVPSSAEEKGNKDTSDNTVRETRSYTKKTTAVNEESEKKEKNTSKIKSLKLKKTQKGTWENKEKEAAVPATVQEKEANNNESKNVSTCDQNVSKNKEETEKPNAEQTNSFISTADTQLPNNPEGLANGDNSKRTSTESTNSEFLEPPKKDKKSKSNKRTRSQSSVEQKKKKKLKHREASEPKEMQKDTQTYDSHPHAADLQKDFGDSQENMQKAQETESNNPVNPVVNGIEKNDTIEKSPVKINQAKAVQNVSPKKNNEGTSQEAGPSGVNDVSVNAADINPCLKSVSLFAEQFSQSKYSDSDNIEDVTKKNTQLNQNNNEKNTKDIANNKENNDEDKDKGASESKTKESNASNSMDKTNKSHGPSLHIEDVLLKSHTESDSESVESPRKRTGGGRAISKEVALANAFGFSSGAVSYNRIKNNKAQSKRFSRRSRVTSRNFVGTIESGSSDEYTTASDSDDVPLPRGWSGPSHRYVKPQSYDFLSNEEGGLFVVGKKKIYPLLLRENGALHYAGAGASHEDENDSYWKTKFLEERKKCAEEKIRADELSRLLQQSKAQQKQAEEREAPSSPILQANQSLSNVTEKNNPKQKKEPVVSEREKKTDETVKIKFTKNHEIELEGQWPHVNPLLERMVEIFKNNEISERTPKKPDQLKIQEVTENEAQNETEKANKEPKSVEDTSRTESKDVKQKGGESETKKAIVRKKKGVKNVEESDKNSDEVVAVSSGKSTPVVAGAVDPEIHEKVTKIESEIFKKIEEIEQTDQSVTKEAASDVNITKRRGRPRKSPSPQPGTSLESAPKKPKITIRPAKRNATDVESDASSKRPSRVPRKYGSDTGLIVQAKAKNAKTNLSISKSDTSIPEDDPTVRYMLPPQSRARKIVSKAKDIRSYHRKSRLFRSSDTSSIHSDSTQGYQDSDASLSNSVPRRKRRVSIGYLSKKGQLIRVKRRSSPYLADDDSNETNELPHIKSGSMPNLSVNSEVYRSESYQLLLPKAKTFSQLDKIDESPVQNEAAENQHQNFTNLSPLTIELYIPSEEFKNDSMRQRSSENSSNVSFPLSPVLSIAGNMSVSKEMISSSLEDHPSLNEIHENDVQPVTNLNKYLMSDVDVSLPLMEQDCGLQSKKRKTGPRSRKRAVSESINPVNVKEHSASDSLDQKLRDLLLESAKKIAQSHTDNPVGTENAMEVDPPDEKKTRSKKRCSTPRKKQTALKIKSPNVDPVLEEHTESCSLGTFGGRKSCPPVINIVPCEDNFILNEKSNLNKTSITEKTKKEKKKKDIIKVKILRPRDKSGNRKVNNSRLSVCTDSGINDTASVLSDDCRCCNVSTELIHNHSDTCLHMDECVANSVEFIETMGKSVISLNSNSIPSEVCFHDLKPSSEDYVTPELFSTDARDATSLSDDIRPNTQSTDTDGATVYHTPLSEGSTNSLVTEDLSDEPPPQPRKKWYLFSEDDTNYTATQDSNTGGVGSNLKQIFPLTCAVPDLSTITEMSRENESMKPNLNTDSEMDVLSQSMFDSNFS